MSYSQGFCRSSLLDQAIHTPWAGPRRNQPQEQEAKDHRLLATVGHRPESTGRPSGEVCHGHFTAEDECGCPREQSQDNQESAAYFKRARKTVHREVIMVYPAIGKAPDLFGSVLKKKQSNRDSHNAEKPGRPHWRIYLIHFQADWKYRWKIVRQVLNPGMLETANSLEVDPIPMNNDEFYSDGHSRRDILRTLAGGAAVLSPAAALFAQVKNAQVKKKSSGSEAASTCTTTCCRRSSRT